MKINDLNGLVLAGGSSSRFGEDKGSFTYHDLPQREYLFHLIKPYCKEVFISLNKNQKLDNYPVLIDEFSRGPISGIFDAFNLNPQTAWLVLACDMPLIEKKDIEFLISKRDRKFEATCFQSKHSIEPLFSIWESSISNALKEYVNKEKGSISPKKFLSKSKVNIIKSNTARTFFNFNSKSDLQKLNKEA